MPVPGKSGVIDCQTESNKLFFHWQRYVVPVWLGQLTVVAPACVWVTFLTKRAESAVGIASITNRLLKSVAFAASPSIGPTPNIFWSVRKVELWV